MVDFALSALGTLGAFFDFEGVEPSGFGIIAAADTDEAGPSEGEGTLRTAVDSISSRSLNIAALVLAATGCNEGAAAKKDAEDDRGN